MLEWSTFWTFIGAGCAYFYAAVRHGYNLSTRWFPIGLSLFCLLVAFEEISWGQRIFGYRPPEYFLEFNYQQEFNFHNIIDTQLRKLALIAVIFGYGVGLPLLNFIPVTRRLFDRIGILPPPAALMPAFLLAGIGQQSYPIKFTGEWIEMMLGTCLLFAAQAEARARIATGTNSSLSASAITGTLFIIFAAGVASTMATSHRRSADQGNVAIAQFELDALYRDFTSSDTRLRRCGFHRRIFTFTENTKQLHLYDGSFAQLTDQNLPEQRAAFFLDPWNYAYWIRDNCSADGRTRTTYLYSFGPNRRRDSTRWEIQGDDIAIVLDGAVDDFRPTSTPGSPD